MTKNNLINLMDFRREKELATDKQLRSDTVRELLRRRHVSEQTDDRRHNARLKFRREKHPIIVVDGIPFRVLDISLTGVKFVGTNLSNITLTSVVHTKVLLNEKYGHSVTAKVVRIVGDLIALQFEEPLNMPELSGAI